MNNPNIADTDLLDHAGEVRDGEELDSATVDAWLKERVPELRGEPEIRQFPGGASNLTYLLRYPERDLVLRRPPFGTKAKGAHDMGREYRVMDRLKPVYPWVPAMVAFCDDQSVLGCDFYVMERLEGIILRKELQLPPGPKCAGSAGPWWTGSSSSTRWIIAKPAWGPWGRAPATCSDRSRAGRTAFEKPIPKT